MRKGVLLTLIGIAVLAVLGYFGWQWNNEKINPPGPINTSTPSNTSTPISTSTPTTTIPYADLIEVYTPINNEFVTSPIRVTGKARGTWYFEASFPVKLVDANGRIITSTYATAKTDWMTTDFVPFETNVKFEVATITPAFLVLANDNPSGLPENDKEIRLPLTLLPKQNNRTVKLYYYDVEKDRDQNGTVLCSRKGLISVEREIPETITPLTFTVKLLLQGVLTKEEKQRGVTTEFPLQGVELVKAVIDDKGIATLTFTDPNIKTGGGSCRVAILWAQIEATARQFPTVKQVKFEPAELFQP